MALETRKRDLMLGIGFLLFSILVWIASFSIRHLVVARIGSAFVPRLAATLLALLSLVLIVQSVTKKASTIPSGASRGGEVDLDAQKKRKKRVQLTFLLILMYLILLEPIGFLITTTLYLFFQFWVLSKGKPKLPLYGIIAIITALGVYYLFVRVFILFLPPGILG